MGRPVCRSLRSDGLIDRGRATLPGLFFLWSSLFPRIRSGGCTTNTHRGADMIGRTDNAMGSNNEAADRRRVPTSPGSGRLLVLVVLASVFLPAARNAPTGGEAVWTRLEMVENTAEGPAYDRCQLEAALKKGHDARWRLFYGEARADAAAGWSALRSASGCRSAEAGPAAMSWGLGGSPYFVVDVTLEKASVSAREILLQATFETRNLTGCDNEGAASYGQSVEKRTVRVPEGGSAVVPILIASDRETDEFRVRELLLKFHARVPGTGPPAEYGELAVTADVPRAELFLDGGPVGRTSGEGAVVLTTVPAGEREVVVRDASGREARALRSEEHTSELQ